MITIDYVKQELNAPNISNTYAQKFIDMTNRSVDRLDDILYQKLAERRNTAAIREVK
ncbi:hypothetical protein [Staphylococcus xylosus]|uniref:hypothetical protein n=1 Tax=Staphylococcus xylosus TaxID=1288 RepID=UPI0015D6635C|nr:hypothetical protein [Staphylococcus xylosus]